MDTSRNVRHLNRLPALPWSRARPLATIVELQNLNQPLPTTTALFEHMADAVYLLDPDTLQHHLGQPRRLGEPGPERERGAQPQRAQPADGRDRCAAVERHRRRDPHAECYTFVGRHRHALGHEVAVEVNTTRFTDQAARVSSCRWRATSRAAWPWKPT
jgi:hypothetical protein